MAPAPPPVWTESWPPLRPDQRWHEWLRRIEAVLFASASPVARDDLARVVGQGASVDLLIAYLAADLAQRPYQVVQVEASWTLRTKPAYAPVIRAAANVDGQARDLSEFDMAVLAAIVFHQPIARDGLRGIFGRDISRDLLARLMDHALVTNGPRAHRRGAPHTYVTTDGFLAALGLASLRDLPDMEHLADAGLSDL